MGKEDVRIHCNTCGLTHHAVRASHREHGSEMMDEFGPFEYENTYEVLQCLGCETVVFRDIGWHDAFGEGTPLFYPPPIARAKPRWSVKLPQTVSSLLDEVYKALSANSPRLAMMGARAVVDVVVLHKVGDVGTFVQKVHALEKQGFIGQRNREFLATALEAGSAAAHRGYAAGTDELNYVMDIVENLLEAVYVLAEAAESLKRSTPVRRSKKTE